MSKSAGQWIGTAVGAVAGFFLPGGYIALGATLGGMVGGLIDPPKGPSVTGPRLEDQSFTSSTLGAALARGYGTFPVSGNVIWLEGDKYREVTTTESQGGKGGGGGSEVTSYTYYATFAVSLLRVTDPTQTVSLRRLWIGSNLVFDAGSDNMSSIIASNNGQGINFTFYSGSDDQSPNPRWQADKGVNAVSGFPGRCYIVIEDLDLTKYGNSLAMAQIKAEVTVGPTTTEYDLITPLLSGGSGTITYHNTCRFSGSHLTYSRLETNTDGGLLAAKSTSVETGVDTVSESSIDLNTGLPITYYLVPYVTQSDRDAILILSGIGYPTNTGVQMWLIDSATTQGSTISNTLVPYENYVAVIDGTDIFLGIYNASATKIIKLTGLAYACSSAGNHRVMSMGASENYLFAVQEPYPLDTSATTTVWKFSRADLSLVATYTETLPSPASISVLDDNTFYTAHSDNHIHKWVGGSVVADLGTLLPHGFGLALTRRRWFSVQSDAPPFVYSVVGGQVAWASYYAGHGVVSAAAASLRDIVTAECGLAGVPASDLDLAGLTDHDVRGCRITERGSVRSALEPLQARFPFDVAHSNYKLRFVSRGGASLETIPEEDLGTVDGSEKDAVLLTVAREMDTQLPRKVSVKYLDVDREYDLGEQYAERPAPNSVNELVLDLPLVMNSGEGAQTADVLLSKEWVERVDIGPFSLPPTWRALEAADVVTIEHRGQSHTVRLTRAEYLPDGRISCNAKLTAAQSYTSTATGEAPAVTGQSLVPLHGSTSAYLLDIPRIRSEQDVTGMAFGLLGRASGWPGGALLRSDDSENTWTSVGAMNASARVFVASNALAAHHGYSIDHAAVLTVAPETPGAALYSVTEEQLYSQANLAAYGIDGRLEIVSFRSVTDNTGSYTLKDFLRGLYGTEWATGLHAAGDLLIMLDTSTVGFFGMPTNTIGSERLYRAVTQGSVIDSAATATDTYEANNLKPLSPVDISGERNSSTLDWTITATRRSRWPVEVFAGVVVPLGESSEAYDLEIWNSDYSTLKRTFSGLTSASTPYTAAQQIADFGSEQQTLYLKWYQLSSVVGRGVASTVTLSRPVADDPFAVNVVLLMHMDSATLPDVKGHAITLIGNAQYSTARQKFGSGSALFDGSGDYLTVYNNGDYNFGTGDLTVEAWVYIAGNSSANAASQRLALIFAVSNGTNDTFEFGLNGDGTTTGTGLYIYTSAKGAADNVSASISQGAWHHVAVCRASGTVRFYLDGNKIGSDLAYAYACGHATNWPAIGGRSYSSNYYHYLNGNLDEVRATKAARYTGATYTVPTAPFQNP